MKFRLLPIALILALAFIFLGVLYVLLNQAEELITDPEISRNGSIEMPEFPVEFFLANPERLDEGHYLLEVRFTEDLMEDERARVVLTETPAGEAIPLVVPADKSNPPDSFTPVVVEWDGVLLLLREVESAE
ncbi:MAG: hypothetical protein LAT55_06205 [Opitutales bacterium]|nr:hypothetical protein [Opitutales bacterium]